MSDIRQWLEGLGLGQYTDAFEREELGVGHVPGLTDGDLKELGLPMGPRKTVLQAARTSGQVTKVPNVVGNIEAKPAQIRDAERRQITVMFCDLVGSTALSENVDPEDLREIMATYQSAAGAVIERYDGHVAQYLGDGLMTYFGWPTAHEDDAHRAVRAGLEIVDAVGELEVPVSLAVRVGIATGLVVVGDTGGGDPSIAKAAAGGTPNIAARLQALAEPNTVIVGDSTRQLISGFFQLERLGVQSIKGISAPQSVYRVTGESDAETRFEASRSVVLTPLIGRENEIGLLLERWQQAKDVDGQVVLLSGEAGIGKSRVAQTLGERLIDEPHIRLHYQCSPHNTNAAFYPFIEQIARTTDFDRDDSPNIKLDKLEALLHRSIGDVDLVAPLFASLLSLPMDRYPPSNKSPQRLKEDTATAIANQIAGLSSRQPVLMIFEDAHWVDPTTLETLGILIDRIRDFSVMLIITFRHEFDPPWTGHSHVTSLTLGRLGRRQGSAMVEGITGGKALPDEVLSQIVAKTDGVPLFVEELTKTVLEAGFLREGSDRYVLQGSLPPLAIPATLQDSLMARIDRLAKVKEVAQIGACIGREFSFELLAAVTPLDDKDLGAALEELVKSELVFRRGAAVDATYVFKHALIQDTAYESLLKNKRQQLHGNIANILEARFPLVKDTQPEQLAHHYHEAGLTQPAIGYWLEAGKRAVSRSANVEARAYLGNGLELLRTLPESAERDRQEIDLQVALGPPVMATSGYTVPEASEIFSRALELCRRHGNPPQIFQALYGLSAFHYICGEFFQARKRSEELVIEADTQSDSSARVVAHRILGTVLFFEGEFSRAREELELALGLYDEQFHRELSNKYGHDPRNFALGLLAESLWMLGYPDQALAAAEKAVAHARMLPDQFNFAWANIHTALIRFLRREPESTLTHARAGFEIVTEQKYPYWVAFSQVLIGWGLAETGDAEAGIEKILQGLEYFRKSGVQCQLPEFLSALSRAYEIAGRDEDAANQISSALKITDRNGEGFSRAELHRMAGSLLCSGTKRDETKAVEQYLHAIEIARSQSAKLWELRAATALAALWQSQGKAREAHDLLHPIYNWFAEGFDTRDLIEAKAVLDELSS